MKNLTTHTAKRVVLLVTLILLVASMLAVPALGYSYTTDSYQVTIDVKEDNTYKVEENISVNFNTEKHGIYRYIPIGSYEGMGFMNVRNVNVADWEYEDYTEDGNRVVQIGSADTTIIGPAIYKLTYDIVIYDDRDTTRDFLYLDVIPTGWETPIESATITMNLPKAVDADQIQVYGGSYGSREEATEKLDWVYDEGNNQIRISGKDMERGDGITVLCNLPEGYWQGVATYDWARNLGVAILFGISILSMVLWYFFGRDKKIIPTVEFYPPEGMNPAEVGYVIDGTVNRKDIVSLVMYYADKGYMTIEPVGKKDFKLTKLKDIDEGEKKFARTLFKGLFDKGDEVNMKDLDKDFGDRYVTAYMQLNDQFSTKRNRQISLKSQLLQIMCLALTIITQIVAVILLGWASDKIAIAVGAGFIALVGIIVLFIAIARNRKVLAMKKGRKFIGGTVVFALEAAMAVGYGLLVAKLVGAMWVGILVAIFLLANYEAIIQMKQRTKKSVVLLGKILGLRNFIETAELDRINTLVEETPDYFYKILPYAYVMGLTDKWAKKFEHIAMVKPHWYMDSARNDAFDIIFFSNMMNRCSRTFADNLHVPLGGDSGSGGGGGGFSSGGGGFSGGGFGGGGGGSW